MEDIYIARDEFAQITNAAELVLTILAHAQGRADSYAARRNDLQILQFPAIKNDPTANGDKVIPCFKKEAKENKQQNNSFVLKSAFYFTKKEISKMPEEFQKFITIKLPIPVRQKKNGVFEMRFRKHGFNICVSSTDRNKLKTKFLAALLSYREKEKTEKQKHRSTLFEDVAAQWLKLKRPTIKANTSEFYDSLFRATLLPAFAGRELSDIRQSNIQALINTYIENGKPRTGVKVYQTLKAIFEFAVGDELIEKSPMRLLKPPKYEEKNGCALTLAEERELIALIEESKCAPEVKAALLFLLYTGIRRSELSSVRIDGEFICVTCAKVRKGYQERQRLIPITPMLARWLPEIEIDDIRKVRPDALTQAMKRLMPQHHLHELRHTFITRAQECGVAREVVSVWAGHAADGTQTSNVYTHFSREFMQKEGQKVSYSLD